MSKNEDEKNKDLAQSEAALKRAALRARRLAEQTATPLVTYRDGKLQKVMVVREDPPKRG